MHEEKKIFVIGFFLACEPSKGDEEKRKRIQHFDLRKEAKKKPQRKFSRTWFDERDFEILFKKKMQRPKKGTKRIKAQSKGREEGKKRFVFKKEIRIFCEENKKKFS